MAAGLGLLALFLLTPRLDDVSSAPGHPAVLAVFLWGVLFDGTHVWATFARSYLAPDEASRAGLPSSWSWGLLAVGPGVAFLDGALGTSGQLFSAFLLGAYVWAYWHLVRQHYGFVMLYRKRAGERDPRGVRLDSFILWAGCLYPYLRYTLSDAYAQSGLPLLLPAPIVTFARFALGLGFWTALSAAIAILLSGRIERLQLGPKHLLLGIVIVFHIVVFGLLEHPLTILATLTIFHNLQYHRIVWQYERGLGRRPCGGLVPYLAAGLTLGLLWYGTRVLGAAALQSDLGRTVLIGLGWGVAFHHYLVDGRIWHVRRTSVVARALDVPVGPR